MKSSFHIRITTYQVQRAQDNECGQGEGWGGLNFLFAMSCHGIAAIAPNCVVHQVHIYEFGNHGAVLVMADILAATDEIIYSLDEGNSWKTVHLSSKMNVPGSLSELLKNPDCSPASETRNEPAPGDQYPHRATRDLHEIPCLWDRGRQQKKPNALQHGIFLQFKNVRGAGVVQFLDFDAMGWLPCKKPEEPGSQSEPRLLLGFRVGRVGALWVRIF